MSTDKTVSAAVNELHRKGFTLEFFVLKEEDRIGCKQPACTLAASEFEVEELHLFQDANVTDQEKAVYAISSGKNDVKGVLVFETADLSAEGDSDIIRKLRAAVKKFIKPIKRSKELTGLSKEHHHALLLSWKIKTGLSRNVEVERINHYVRWFYNTHLIPHFEVEEKYLFTLLPASDANRLRAQEQHAQLKGLIENGIPDRERLMEFSDALNDHIRFEERVLFNEIQKLADSHQLKVLEQHHTDEKFCDNESDPFWK